MSRHSTRTLTMFVPSALNSSRVKLRGPSPSVSSCVESSIIVSWLRLACAGPGTRSAAASAQADRMNGISSRLIREPEEATGVTPVDAAGCGGDKVPPVTRLSNFVLPTEKEAPADAEAVSHKLLVRAGLIRQVSSGLWTFMPAGWRAHRRVEQIIREELDAIGGQEMLMPVMLPAELWRATGRYDIDELFKLQDRRGADFVLAMTHEECITFHVSRLLRSYRDLPKILYHLQTKERDEPRPRAGLLRTRELIMKDSFL